MYSKEPPNFLIASDFSKHVKPEAVVPEPEPENEPDTDSVADLIDTSEVCSTYCLQLDSLTLKLFDHIEVANMNKHFVSGSHNDLSLYNLTQKILSTQFFRSTVIRLGFKFRDFYSGLF